MKQQNTYTKGHNDETRYIQKTRKKREAKTRDGDDDLHKCDIFSRHAASMLRDSNYMEILSGCINSELCCTMVMK